MAGPPSLPPLSLLVGVNAKVELGEGFIRMKLEKMAAADQSAQTET